MDATNIFELINTVPNSEDWLRKRKGVVDVSIGSSAMGAAAGISAFKTRNQLLHELVYGSDFKGNAATAHGHRYENLCAERWSIRNAGVKTFEVGICRPTKHNSRFNDHSQPGYPYFGVSVDRWACTTCAVPSENMLEHVECAGFRVIECKCPYSRRSFETYYDKKIKDEHLAQLHLQMAVLGLREIDYMVTLVSSQGILQEERMATVYFSEEFWEWIYPKALEVAFIAISVLWDAQELKEVEELGEFPPSTTKIVWH